MELDVLKIWPDWKATRLIGEGSFGKVYEIVRNNFGIEERCALKVITIPSSPAELQSMRNEGMDEASTMAYYRGLVEEFVQEIALMSKLKGNINIVGYDDYAVVPHADSIGWDILIRMELLTALPKYMQDHPLTECDVIKLGTDLCNALEVCHAQKIIHRDIKPDNIFVSQNGDFKLGDFGVARTIEKTVSGLSKKGTYTYMAPEVYKGDPYGTNVDLYSLGIVMYKLLNNNREPFLPPHPEVIKYSDKNDALVRRLGGEQIPPPANGDGALHSIVLKSVSFHSWERYQQPAQLKVELQGVKTSLETGAAPVLQAEQIAASNTNKTGQSIPLQPEYSVKTAQPAPNNIFLFGADETSPREEKTEKTNKTLKLTATILGWVGALLWCLIFAEDGDALFLFSLLVTACMIPLSIVKSNMLQKICSIVMLVFSVITFNICNAAAAILYLCMKKTQ